MSDSDSDFVQEERDFSLVHALQTFKATVDSQIDVIKNEPLLLLDDSNNYWWLVKPLSSNQIGYIPAEIVETPSERLARVNRHRNLQLSEFKETEDYVGKLGDTIKNVSFSEETVDNHGEVGLLQQMGNKRASAGAGLFLRTDSKFEEEEDTEELSDEYPDDEILDDEVDAEDLKEVAEDLQSPSPEFAPKAVDIKEDVKIVKPEPRKDSKLPKKQLEIINVPTTREIEEPKAEIQNKAVEKTHEPIKPKDSTTLAKLEGKVRPSPVKNFPKSTKVTAIRIYQGKMSNQQEKAQFKTVAATDATTVGQLLKQAALKFKVFGKIGKSGLEVDKRSSVDDMLGTWSLSLKSKKGERRLLNHELIVDVLHNLNVKMDKRRSLFSKSNDQVEVSTLQEEVKVFLNESYNKPLTKEELIVNTNSVKPLRPLSSLTNQVAQMKEKKRATVDVGENISKRNTFSDALGTWILARMILNTDQRLVKTVKVPVSVKFGDLVQSTIRKISAKNGIQNIAFDSAFVDGYNTSLNVTETIKEALLRHNIDVETLDKQRPVNIHVMVRMVADSSVAMQITKKRSTFTSELPLNELIENYSIETVDQKNDAMVLPTDKSPSCPPRRQLPMPEKHDRKPIRAHELIHSETLTQVSQSGDSLLSIVDNVKGVSSFDDFIASISSESDF